MCTKQKISPIKGILVETMKFDQQLHKLVKIVNLAKFDPFLGISEPPESEGGGAENENSA